MPAPGAGTHECRGNTVARVRIVSVQRLPSVTFSCTSAACFSVRVSCHAKSRVPLARASAGQLHVGHAVKATSTPWGGRWQESRSLSADARDGGG